MPPKRKRIYLDEVSGTSVDTRSDTTRKGYHEGRASSVQSRSYHPIVDLYNFIEEKSDTRTPGLNIGIINVPLPGNINSAISRASGIKGLIPRFNKFAEYYGYTPVGKGASIAEAERVIKAGLKQHNTFYRGLSVPKDKSTINKALGKEATEKEVLEYMAKNGSIDPNNTYFSPDNRASQYARQGDVAVVTRKYKLGEDPYTWLDDADFVYNTTPATSVAPKGQINYPWAGKAIEKAPPGEVRINPEDYIFEGWLPKTEWEYGAYVPVKEFKGSKNLYFNEAAGHHKPKFRLGGKYAII